MTIARAKPAFECQLCGEPVKKPEYVYCDTCAEFVLRAVAKKMLNHVSVHLSGGRTVEVAGPGRRVREN